MRESTVKDSVENTRNPFLASSDGAWYIYDILFRPPLGILNCSKPLLPKTELSLHFDRAVSSLALIAKTNDAENPYGDKSIDLENCFLEADYYTTQNLRNEFSRINQQDIIYRFDEISGLLKIF